MSSCKLTLIGLYEYDPTIFDNLSFPDGIVKADAVNEILLRSGEFEIVYPDPNFLKQVIGHWGRKHYRTFEKWVEGLSKEFEPLYNFDRFEEYTDTRSHADEKHNTEDRDRSDDLTRSEYRNRADETKTADARTKAATSENEKNEHSSQASETATNTDLDSTTTTSVSAYDASTYQPKEQEVVDSTTGVSGSNLTQNAGDSKEENKSSENETSNSSEKTKENEVSGGAQSSSGNESVTGHETTAGNEETKHTAHLYGNIGVTTSTQLLEDFLRVERWNIYEHIADIFVGEFCVMVYV